MQSDCSEQNLKTFINGLGFKVFSLELIKTAFTHSSFTKENNKTFLECYERLEFLGDAVLKMAVTDYLYEKFPDKEEGFLTKIRSIVVSDEILFKVAQKINIAPHIILGKAEEKCGGRELESIQACVMEAMFGALYLSSDREILNRFIVNELAQYIDDIAENRTIYNAKALLQEYTQGESKCLPEYRVVKEIGAAHNKTFTVEVTYKNRILATAEGKTKKQAQQDAAFIACKKLGLIKEEKQ